VDPEVPRNQLLLSLLYASASSHMTSFDGSAAVSATPDCYLGVTLHLDVMV
jgi:hypothetical protein